MAASVNSFGETDAQTLKLYVELHRKMTQSERLTRVFELCEFQRGLVQSNVQAMYPQASEHEVRYRIEARLYGDDLARKAYGWDADGGLCTRLPAHFRNWSPYLTYLKRPT